MRIRYIRQHLFPGLHITLQEMLWIIKMQATKFLASQIAQEVPHVIRSINMLLSAEELCIHIKIRTKFFSWCRAFSGCYEGLCIQIWASSERDRLHIAYSFPVVSAFFCFASL